MLVLSRRSGERIVIGDDVVITVLETSGNNTRLGIDAPDEVPIRRSELPSCDFSRCLEFAVDWC